MTRRNAIRLLRRSPFVMMRVLVLGAFLSVAGCADIRFVIFEPVKTDLVEKNLKIGTSTREDVRKLLGEPTGSGRSMLPFDEKPLTLWGYYYEVGSMSQTEGTWLFIYFDEDSYRGYLWFSDKLKTASSES